MHLTLPSTEDVKQQNLLDLNKTTKIQIADPHRQPTMNAKAEGKRNAPHSKFQNNGLKKINLSQQ